MVEITAIKSHVSMYPINSIWILSSDCVTNAVTISGPLGLDLTGAASCGDNLGPVNPGVGFGAGSGAAAIGGAPGAAEAMAAI